jgi:hypothetical protein
VESLTLEQHIPIQGNIYLRSLVCYLANKSENSRLPPEPRPWSDIDMRKAVLPRPLDLATALDFIERAIVVPLYIGLVVRMFGGYLATGRLIYLVNILS